MKLEAKLVTKDLNGNTITIDQPLHDCTEEDWALFYPPDTDTQIYIKERALRFGAEEKDVKASFKCLDVTE